MKTKIIVLFLLSALVACKKVDVIKPPANVDTLQLTKYSWQENKIFSMSDDSVMTDMTNILMTDSCAPRIYTFNIERKYNDRYLCSNYIHSEYHYWHYTNDFNYLCCTYTSDSADLSDKFKILLLNDTILKLQYIEVDKSSSPTIIYYYKPISKEDIYE